MWPIFIGVGHKRRGNKTVSRRLPQGFEYPRVAHCLRSAPAWRSDLRSHHLLATLAEGFFIPLGEEKREGSQREAERNEAKAVTLVFQAFVKPR